MPYKRIKKLPSFLYFVYQLGKLDFVALTLGQAKDMAQEEGYGRLPYRIERWKRSGNWTYEFDKIIQEEGIIGR